MATSYIVERVDTESGGRQFDVVARRPTQAELKQRGWATYTLRRRDGSVVKRWRVVRNRNGNPKVESETPVNLEGVTTLNLERMLRAYERIVKHWPVKAADVRKINTELSGREGFVVAESDIPDRPGSVVQRGLFE